MAKKRTVKRKRATSKSKPNTKKTPKKQSAPKRSKTKHASKIKQKIQRSTAAIQQTMESEHIIEQKLQRFVSWTSIALLILTNFLAAILLVPFLLFFEGIAQYIVVALFAIGLGLIFNLLIHSIEHLGDKHHIIAGVAVPVFALIDVAILFGILEAAKEKLELTVEYNYTALVVIFIFVFLIPYFVDIVMEKHTFK
jgi:ABC-type proline/glycine betaine transport system permease subunit